MKDYEVISCTEPDGSTHLLLKKGGKTMVKEEDVFDSIDDVHCDTLGHKKRKQTHNEVSRRFSKIANDQVMQFLAVCPVCT